MITFSLNQRESKAMESKITKKIQDKIAKKMPAWTKEAGEIIVGMVTASSATEAEHMAGNFEWDHSYTVPNKGGGPPSIAVRDAMTFDARKSSSMIQKVPGATIAGFGNVPLLSELSPHWIYYEYGSTRSFNPDSLITGDQLAVAKSRYSPMFTHFGSRFKGGHMNYIFFSTESMGVRRPGEGKLVGVDSYEIGSPIGRLAAAWERGTRGRHIYTAARPQILSLYKKHMKALVSSGAQK